MKNELSQIIEEYRRFRESGRPAARSTFNLPDGSVVELCHTKGADWTLCVLRAGDGALIPVAVGDDVGLLMSRYEQILQEWQPALWPPLRVVVAGVPRVFVPAGMSLLVGVADFGQGALLIGVVKRAGKSGLALLYIDEARISVVHFGDPMDLRSVDVDGLLELQSTAIRAPTGQILPELMVALARLLARALRTCKRSCKRPRGTGSIHLFMWVIVQLIRRGVEDLYGRRSELAEQIKAYLPGVDLPLEALGDDLVLLLATKTCLMERKDRVIWRLRLSGLNKLDNPLLRRFCAEAHEIVVDVDSFARLCAGDEPPARSKYRGPLFRCPGTTEAVPDPSAPPEDLCILASKSGTADPVEQPTTEAGAPAEVSEQPSTAFVPAETVREMLLFVQMLLDRTESARALTAVSVTEDA